MPLLDQKQIDVRRSAELLYASGQTIWDERDKWNKYKRARIEAFAHQVCRPVFLSSNLTLDAGCGSSRYDWIPRNTVSIDRFEAQVMHQERGVVGDIERLPFSSSAFDLIICVASVLNYVSAAEAIAEFSRVLNVRGHLLLHFECSQSFEHFGTSAWNALAASVTTTNSDRPDTIWVYSQRFVASQLRSAGFAIVAEQRFHILTSLAVRLGFNQQVAACLRHLDAPAWPLRFFADDIILLAEKVR